MCSRACVSECVTTCIFVRMCVCACVCASAPNLTLTVASPSEDEAVLSEIFIVTLPARMNIRPVRLQLPFYDNLAAENERVLLRARSPNSLQWSLPEFNIVVRLRSWHGCVTLRKNNVAPIGYNTLYNYSYINYSLHIGSAYNCLLYKLEYYCS